MNELAMANRFKEAYDQPTDSELAKTIRDTLDALDKCTNPDADTYEHVYGARVLLRHIAVWLEGGHDDRKMIDLLRINIEGTHKRLTKIEE